MTFLSKNRTNLIICLVFFIFILFTAMLASGAEAINIVSVSPDSVSHDGEETITISGSGFVSDMKVFFNGTQVDPFKVEINTNTTPNTAKVKCPSMNVGYVDIRLESPTDSTVRLNAFWSRSSPEITGLSKTSGTTLGGDPVVISGSEFGLKDKLGNSAVQVYLVTTLLDNVTCASESEIQIITPPGTLGAKSLQVINADGGSFTMPAAFTYIASSPAITSVSPDYGSLAGGTTITILGSGFSPDARVKVGDHWAQEVTCIGGTQLTAVTPRGETTDSKVDVLVINPDNVSAVKEDAFEYIVTPVIENITPNFGAPGEDRSSNPIIISGANFDTAGVDVYFGGQKADIKVPNTSTQIEVVKLPGGTPGTVQVKVVNKSDAKQEFTLLNGFTFKSEKSHPKINEIDPSSGSTEETTRVTIKGEQLLTGARLFIGETEISLADAVFTSTSEVEVSIPPSGTAGKKAFRWVNSDGGEYIFGDEDGETGFTYVRPVDMVRIISVTPNRGPEDQKTPIVISGLNFVDPGIEGNTLEIRIGDVLIPETDIQWKDSRTIYARTPLGYVQGDDTETSWDVTVKQSFKEGTNVITQRYTLVNGFTYVLPGSKPTIAQIYDQEFFLQEGIATNSGPLAGSNEVVIVGTDFRTQGSTMPTVEFGKNSAWKGAQVVEVISLDPEHQDDPDDPNYDPDLPRYIKGVAEMIIVARAPAGTATGSVDVRVTNPDLGTVTLPDGWIYKTCNLMIDAITPDFGPVTGGIDVVISGANFDEDARVGVKFVHEYEDGTPEETTVVEEVYKVTPTQIHFKLPKSFSGVKDVVVYNRFGERTLEDGFTYVGLASGPVIEDIDPDQGTAEGGDVITITGQDFRSNSIVTMGGAEAEVVSADWYTLTVITPPGTPGLCDVMVTNPDGAWVVAEGAFTYISYPIVDSITPGVVNTAGGTIVTISGDQFYEGAVVIFEKDGREYSLPPEDIRVADINTIYARVPGVDEEGYYDVIVRNLDYDSATGLGEDILEKGIMYEEPPDKLPVVKSINPGQGPTTGGIQAVVACENAAPDARIFIGLEEAQVTGYLGVNDLGEHRFNIIVPPNEEGNYYVTVTNPDGGTGVSDTAIFEYRTASTEMSITSVSPSSGSVGGGTFVVIRGKDFRSGAEVYFGSNKAEKVIVTLEDPVSRSYKISCDTPAGDLGFVDVIVVNPDNSFGVAVLEDGFEYRIPASKPEITSVTPFKGPVSGGTRITINGTDFRAGVSVYLDGLPALNVTLVDSRTITAVTPPHGAGKTAVTVVNYDGGSDTFGDDTDEAGFTYAVPGSSPQVTSVDPEFGPAGQTTPTIITGLDFRATPQVYFGSIPSPKVEYVDYKTLEAVAPAQGAGTVDVTVVNGDFGTGTLTNGFTYRSSVPRIIGLNPSVGNRLGGDLVTILGEELSVTAAVYFEQGTLVAQAEVLPESTSEALIIRTPAAPNGVIGFYDVRVVNPDGAEDVLEKGFKYAVPDSAPEIESVTPDSGSLLGGTPIKIRGRDFRDDAWVFIGGKEATNVQVVDPYTIKAVTPAHSLGPKDVTVVNYDGGSDTLEDGFTYAAPLSEPVVDSVTPDKGPQVGGTEITITGRDFREGIKVYVGGEQCDDTYVTLVDYKTVTAVTPPGQPGTVDVTVTNTDMGSFTLEEGFTYVYVEIPVIQRITPNEGVSEGGTEIVVVGSKFEKGLTLTIGGAQADITDVAETEIKAVTPPGEVGWQDVVITNPSGGRVVLEDGFKYIRSRTEPDTPGFLEATTEDKTTIKLEWGAAEFASYYEIYVREKGEDTYRFVDQTKSDVHVYYVTGLQPSTTYYFQVRAINELGLSGFTATDSAKTKSGSIPKPGEDELEELQDEVQVIIGQGTRTLTVSSKRALRDCNYTFDFLDAVSQKNPVKIVQLNADVALDVQQEIVVNLPGCKITVPPSLWNLPAINSLTSKESRESVVRLILTDAGQREAESALAYLPSGAKIISKVYSVQMEVISRGKSEFVDLFAYPVNIAFEIPVGKSNLRNIAVYGRNLNGTWTKASGSSVSYLTAKAFTYAPTSFLLAGF